MKNKLQKREGEPNGYYSYEAINGRKYSVVNFHTTMRGHPAPESIFLGWEALEIKGEELDSRPIRASTWEDLRKSLDYYNLI